MPLTIKQSGWPQTHKNTPFLNMVVGKCAKTLSVARVVWWRWAQRCTMVAPVFMTADSSITRLPSTNLPSVGP